MVESQNFSDAENYLKEKYFNNSRTLDNLRLSLGLDVNISIKELLLYMFGFIKKIKNKEEIIDEEFDKFDDKYRPDENSFYAIKQVFEAYATDKNFREKVDSGNYSELNNEPSGEFFFKIPKDFINKIPKYIKENINLERFIDA